MSSADLRASRPRSSSTVRSGHRFALTVTVLGFILLAAAQNIGTAAGGFLFYAVGYSGLQIMVHAPRRRAR